MGIYHKLREISAASEASVKQAQTNREISPDDPVDFDPCPKYDTIGNGQCDKENFNLICSFDAGDCHIGWDRYE